MELTAPELWSRICEAVRPAVPEQGYRTWLSGLRAVGLSDDGDTAASCELTVDFAGFGFTSATVKCQDYGGGGLACSDSFQDAAPNSAVAGQGKPIPLEIGRHSYRMLRFCE